MTISLAAIGIPDSVTATIQDNTLLRVFYDALFPELLYRADMTPELWVANIGENLIMTRSGLLPVKINPLTPGSDPQPNQFSVEQWSAQASQYGDTLDTHMPTNYVSMASTFMRNIMNLGVNAGQTVNRLARNAQFRAYLSGEAMALAATAAGQINIPVSTINGFTEALQTGRFRAVSAANPLAVSFPGGTEPDNFVVAANPADPANPYGPGVLTLASVLTVGIGGRSAILSSNRAKRVRVGGGATIDAITSSQTLTLDNCTAAVARLREMNVKPHADGWYHAHITPAGEQQIFGDNHWQRLHQSIPDGTPYKQFICGEQVGIRFFRNTESPNRSTVSSTLATGTKALVAPEIGGEVVNETGLNIARMLVTGGGVGYEKYLDESKFISEAGVQGKIGEFNVVNNGVQILTDRIRLILRAPQDRLQQVVASSWSWSGDFPIPTDALTGDPSKYKRAVVVEHVGSNL